MDTAKIDQIIERYNRNPHYANEMLQDVQKEYDYLPEDVLRYISDEINSPQGEIYFIGSFYPTFSLTHPAERNTNEPLKPFKAFMKEQKRDFIHPESDSPLIVLKNIGKIDPKSIDSYISAGGYIAFQKALKLMDRESVLNEIKLSGLIGRCGFGTMIGDKWEETSKAVESTGNPAYLICNADEGIPGGFAYRKMVENDPHSIIEGMLIGAYAIGADKGIINIRNCYSDALEVMKKAVDDARAKGFLGFNILGTRFSFDIEIRRSPGAYVNFDLTALLESLSGKAAVPVATYTPFTQKGYKGMPTMISCVETWMNIATIIDKGATWFEKIGKSGTKVISLTGDVNRRGFTEIPLGTTLRDIIYKTGGGIPDDQRLKAVQVGGPSGAFLPEKMLDTPLDYDSIKKASSIMGTGMIRVLNNQACVAEITRDCMEYLKDESFGKAVPGREGMTVVHHMLDKIIKGEGKEDDLEILRSVATSMSAASLSGLAATASNPVISSLKYFKSDYKYYLKGK